MSIVVNEHLQLLYKAVLLVAGDERLYMCASGDGATVLVVLHCSEVYLWQLRPGVTIFDAAPADVTGRWSRVGCDDDGTLPGRGQTEACVHAVFCINDRCVSTLTFQIVVHIRLFIFRKIAILYGLIRPYTFIRFWSNPPYTIFIWSMFITLKIFNIFEVILR